MSTNTEFPRLERLTPDLEYALVRERTNYSQFVASRPAHEFERKAPRPLPQVTLANLCAMKNAFLNETDSSGNVLWYAFYSDRVEQEANVSISVSPDDLTWLCSPQDIVLLSDLRSDHFTRVDRIIGDRIYLLDPWPEQFPIRHVKRENGDLTLFIEKHDFREAAIGLLTLDSSQLLNNFIKHRPDLAEDFELRFALANAILLRNSPKLSWFVAGHLGRAIFLAHKAGSMRFPLMVSRHYLALVEAEALKAEAQLPDYLHGELEKLMSNCDLAALEAHLAAPDLARAARAHARLGNVEIARHHVDAALRDDPLNDDALLAGAEVNCALNNMTDAVRVAKSGLAANRARLNAVAEEIAMLEKTDAANKQQLELRARELESRRIKFHNILQA